MLGLKRKLAKIRSQILLTLLKYLYPDFTVVYQMNHSDEVAIEVTKPYCVIYGCRITGSFDGGIKAGC